MNSYCHLPWAKVFCSVVLLELTIQTGVFASNTIADLEILSYFITKPVL